MTFPSPLVGEGGSLARSGSETDEGSVSADRDPSSAFASLRHLLPQGEKEEKRDAYEVICPTAQTFSAPRMKIFRFVIPPNQP
jgi:hypothetical protein